MFEFVAQAANALAKEWDRRALVRQLSQLNDHLLDDIGLRREQLPTLMMASERRHERGPQRRLASRPELIGCG
jgi:uncharacterized protein YjiS (DUF1127 family)